MALNGKVDRRTYERNSFIFGIFILLIASIIAGFIASYLLGGGSMDVVSSADISAMWQFILTDAAFDKKQGSLGIYAGVLIFLIAFC